MEHSIKFPMVQKFFEGGFWSASRVRDAVDKKWITPAEYKEITGMEYEVI